MCKCLLQLGQSLGHHPSSTRLLSFAYCAVNLIGLTDIASAVSEWLLFADCVEKVGSGRGGPGRRYGCAVTVARPALHGRYWLGHGDHFRHLAWVLGGGGETPAWRGRGKGHLYRGLIAFLVKSSP
jgi:hypothetical protein